MSALTGKALVEHQKYIADNILSVMETYFDRGTVLAGGAPRDWFMSSPANDLDIYFRNTLGLKFKEVFTEIFKSKILGDDLKQGEGDLDFTEIKGKHNGEEYSGLNIPISHIFNFNIGGVNVQLIGVDEAPSVNLYQQVLGAFDVGLCKISYRGGRFGTGVAFEEDVKSKTITVFVENLSDYQLKHCLTRHIPKLQRYFPDYRLVLDN